MKCPKCKTDQDHRVLQTRTVDDVIKRRRECKWCGYRFTTYERISIPKGIEDRG